jgi:hypothetical protein
LLISVLTFCFLIDNGFCQQPSPAADSNSINTGMEDTSESKEEESGMDFWQKIWGTKARDAVLLGMWSIHLDGTGEYFGDGRNNDQGELLGIQIYGITAGTFINSKDDRAWFLGPAREVYSHNFSDDIRFDAGYKFGLLYGYDEDDLITVGGVSAFAMATFGISWKRIGFDFGIVPVGIITGNFRFDIDF